MFSLTDPAPQLLAPHYYFQTLCYSIPEMFQLWLLCKQTVPYNTVTYLLLLLVIISQRFQFLPHSFSLQYNSCLILGDYNIHTDGCSNVLLSCFLNSSSPMNLSSALPQPLTVMATPQTLSLLITTTRHLDFMHPHLSTSYFLSSFPLVFQLQQLLDSTGNSKPSTLQAICYPSHPQYPSFHPYPNSIINYYKHSFGPLITSWVPATPTLVSYSDLRACCWIWLKENPTVLPDWSHHDPGPSGPSVLPGSQTILCSPTPLHCNFIPSFSNFQRLLSHPYSQLRPCFPGHVRNHSLPNLKIYHSALPPTP